VARILVAMSGGVDSSVAAAILKEAGHEIVGATLRTFCYTSGPAHAKSCCGLEGVADARAVAQTLEIPHAVYDVEEEFTRDVIDDFVSEYAQGRTPNPCVRCNSFTKFGDLLRRGREMGAEGIATGHYVRIQREPPLGPALYRGADTSKDQAYFLWGLPAETLPSLYFPLGDLTKEEVREAARIRELVTAEKPESQEICFVPTGDYRDLLRTRLKSTHPSFQPGSIITTGGEPVGEHDGYAAFTVGQRKGLPGGFPEAMFVVEIRPSSREVVVGTRSEMFADSVKIRDLNWLGPVPEKGESLDVQLRHRATPVGARVDSISQEGITLSLDEAQFAVTPGQSGVIFTGDRVRGGGRIV
jgi:tRNA-specific 2-thiouridylase